MGVYPNSFPSACTFAPDGFEEMDIFCVVPCIILAQPEITTLAIKRTILYFPLYLPFNASSLFPGGTFKSFKLCAEFK